MLICLFLEEVVRIVLGVWSVSQDGDARLNLFSNQFILNYEGENEILFLDFSEKYKYRVQSRRRVRSRVDNISLSKRTCVLYVFEFLIVVRRPCQSLFPFNEIDQELSGKNQMKIIPHIHHASKFFFRAILRYNSAHTRAYSRWHIEKVVSS